MAESYEQKPRKRKNRSKKNRSHARWKRTGPAGGALINVAPVFSEDHRFLAVLTSLELRLYSFSARQCVARVAVEEASLAVDLFVDSAAGLSAEGYPKIWVARRNGVCTVTDWHTEKTINLNASGVARIHKIVSVAENDVVLVASALVKDSKLCIVRVLDGVLTTLLEIAQADLLSLSHSKTHAIFRTAISDKTVKKSSSSAVEILTVVKITEDKTCISSTIERSRSSSTIAVADNSIVAVGSVTGVIDLYYPVGDADGGVLEYRQASKSYLIRTLKWHLDPVRALSFSLDGNYLLSGGNEKVLLFWQLDTGNVQFLPRLPGPITNVVVDDSSTTYALCLGNNFDDIIVLAATDLDARLRISSINVAYASLPPLSMARATLSSAGPLTSSSLKLLNLKKEISHSRGVLTKLRDSLESDLPNLTIFPTVVHNKLVTSKSTKSRPYWYFPTTSDAQIQIYDPTKGEQVALLPVARTLQLGKVLFEEAIPDPVITQIVLAADAKWMATVDETRTQPIDRLLSKADVQINLKFWSDDSENSEDAIAWKLVSRIINPHGVNVPVAAVAAAPETYYQGQAFITACHGGGLRLWRPRFPRVQTRQVEWSARHILDPKYVCQISRLSPPEFDESSLEDVCLAWAADGSILVLGLGTEITIVSVPTRSTASFDVVRSLSGMAGSPVRSLGIIDTTIIAVTESSVSVYDILSDTVTWSVAPGFVPKGSRSLVAYGSSSFCVAVNSASLAVSNSNPTPALLSNLYIFSTKSPVPLHVMRHSQPIAAVHSVATGSSQSYAFIDTDRMFYSVVGPDAVEAKKVAADAEESVEAAEWEQDAEEQANVTAILHPKLGKYTVPESDGQAVAVDGSSARANVVLNPSILDSVFDGPDYAIGDLGGVFEKLLSAIGQQQE